MKKYANEHDPETVIRATSQDVAN